jgi:ABC-type multidrug transport system ATPase subunit
MQLCLVNVQKTYPNGTKALDGVSLDIPEGMFGLLGPNGAGKSTLMRTLASLQLPDTGQIHFGDIDVLKEPRALRSVLGYLPQDFGVFPGVSAERLLHYFAQLKGLQTQRARTKAVGQALVLTHLSSHRTQAVSTFSGGMKRRFGIAQLLLNNPKLIIVDEPTAGLDPSERRHFLDLLSGLSAEKTILFSTHIVEDVRVLCPSFAIMNRGQLLLRANTQEALEELDGQVWVGHDRDGLLPEDATLLTQSSPRPGENSYRVWCRYRPNPAFQAATPELEDLYFLHLNRH